MVEYTDQDVVINAPYMLKLKNTDSYWVWLECLGTHTITGDPLPGGGGLLKINKGIFCLKDVSAYGGALMTASNPDLYYGTGGGCVQIGHGFQRSESWNPPADPPRINLTDDNYHTLYITAGSSLPNGIDAVLADMKLKNLTTTGSVSFSASMDQIRFPISGQNEYWWMCKPSDNRIFAVYKYTSPATWMMSLSSNGQLDLPIQGSGGGLKIGVDTNLYRSAQDVLKTDDSFAVGQYASISSAGDAIFNSVKGTSYAGALKAGNEGTIAWDTPWLYITSHNKHMKLVTPANKVLELNSGGNLAFNVGGDFITVYGSKTFAPNGNNQGNIGGNGVAGAYWGSGWFNYLRYKNLSSFDALDDLALVKQYTTKSIVEDDVEREVVDLETLPVVKADGTDFVDSGKLGGFLLGCVKKLVLRMEKLEAELKK